MSPFDGPAKPGPWTVDDVLALPVDDLTALAGVTTRIGRSFPFDLDPADLARAPR